MRSDAYTFLRCCIDLYMKMGMCICVAWLNGLPAQCPGMAKSLATPLVRHTVYTLSV